MLTATPTGRESTRRTLAAIHLAWLDGGVRTSRETAKKPTAVAAPMSAHIHHEKRGCVSSGRGHMVPPPRGSRWMMHVGSVRRVIQRPTATPTGTDASVMTVAIRSLIAQQCYCEGSGAA